MGVSVLISQSPVRQTMKGFYSIFAALCLTAYTNASPALPLFSLVKFENKPCNTGSNNDRMGTCYTQQECDNLGGKKMGDTCAEGFGVCCEFSEFECGDTSNQNNTFLIKANQPASSSCTYKICPKSDNVCRIKFQFDALTLAAPVLGTAGTPVMGAASAIGACATDSFSITGGTGNASPIICGTNTGQHMIMDSDGDACNTININIGAGSTSSWNIHVTQYDCTDMTLLENTAGPKGCLQYHLGNGAATGATAPDGTGSIDNLGFPADTTATLDGATTHLQNQNYNICIRRVGTFTRICYTVQAAGTASATDHDGFGLSTQAMTTAMSAVDGGCTTDFITIPNGQEMAAINAPAFKFCGNFLDNNAIAQAANAVVCSNVQPFIIGVNFDGSELQGNTDTTDDETILFPAGTVGFHFAFAQS